LWSLWLAFEFLFLGSSSFVRLWDEADSYLPARISVAQRLLAGDLGYLNPLWVSGTDILASGLTPLLDTLFFTFLPGWLAYGIFMWLQRFVAGYFTYRLLKDSLNLKILPSLFGGFAYSLFAQSTFDFNHSAGLPSIRWIGAAWNTICIVGAGSHRSGQEVPSICLCNRAWNSFLCLIILLPGVLLHTNNPLLVPIYQASA
jgi:hypothetical protein